MQFIVYYCSTVFKNGSRDPGRRGTTTRMFGCPNFLVVLFVLFVEMYIYTMLSREKNRVQRLLPRYSYSLFGRDNAEKMSLTQDFALTPRHCCR